MLIYFIYVEFIQAYEIKLEREADCDEAVCCNTGNSTLIMGLVYRSPIINGEDNTNIQNAMNEVSKGNVALWEILTTDTYNGMF